MEKSILALFAVLISAHFSIAQENQREFEMNDGDTIYTMKQYIFCMYLSGSEPSQSEEERTKIQEKHMAHIGNMADEHHLQMAGPFGDESDKRGLLIFDLATLDEAEEIVSQDPAVQANRLSFECHPVWLAKGSKLE